jgi:serine/threonine protein kinase
MSGSTTRKNFDGDDVLRELMSSMLSGRYKEETYLWDVSSVCRSRPESAPRLLALIDRYRRLGRMPVSQHEKVKARIEQVMSVVNPVARKTADHMTHLAPAPPLPAANDGGGDDDVSALSDEEAVAAFEEEEDDSDLPDDYTEESMTRELRARAPAPKAAAAAPVAAASAPVVPVPVARDALQTRVLPASAMLEAMTPEMSPETRVLSQTRVMAKAPPAGATVSPAPDSDRAPSTGRPADSLANLTSAVTPIGVGTVLHDRYELKQLLGRGGIATVYKAIDRYRVNLGLEDCYVAVKIVQPHPARPGSVAALGREFHNAQLLSHPNVINVFNIDHAGDASFYTMELLDGERVSQIVKRVQVLPRRQALAVIRDIGAAVAHAHSRGVVHADLKPHNVMITRIGQVRVLDFGSGVIRAREPWISEMSPDDTYRQATPAYASCEQLEGWSADPRDDIYAMSCLAYLLLTGKHPFHMLPSLDARARRLKPRRPAGLRGEAWRALRRGLAWTREQRTISVEDWLQQLGVADAVESLPPLPLLQTGKPYSAWMHRAAAAGVIVAGLGLAAFTVEHQDRFDWHPTLAKAQGRLSDAWRGLQSITDSPDGAISGVTPSAAADSLPLPLPPPPPPAAAHKGGGHSSPSASASPHASRSAGDETTAPVAVAAGSGEEKVAMIAPAVAGGASVAADPQPADKPVVTGYSDDPANSPDPPRLEFAAPSYVVGGTEPAARIVIRRNGKADGDVNFVWWTEEASAKADVDYASLGRRIERIPSGTDKITVYVPIISSPTRHEITQFYVALGEPGSLHSNGPGTRSLVTIDHGN